MRRTCILNNNQKHPVITALVLTFFPSQPRRKLSLSGGSAAKVFEPRSQKTKLKTAKAGRVLCRPPGRLGFRGFGDERGRLFFGYFLLAKPKESN